VQSEQGAAFNEQDIDTLQGMANSVATALENARLFRDTQKSLEELRLIQRESVVKNWSESSGGNKAMSMLPQPRDFHRMPPFLLLMCR